MAESTVESYAVLLCDAAQRRLGDVAARELAGPRYGERVIDRAAELALREVLARLWRSGWEPRDVHQIALRRLDRRAVALTVDVLAAEAAVRSAAAVPPRWREQLDGIGATVWWAGDSPLLGQWARRHATQRVAALRSVLAVLEALLPLPRLPEMPDPSGSVSGVDGKVLARIRALLAKAESTAFPEEAEALSAKAQELMSRYSFEQALVGSPGARTGSARRFWLDQPYLGPKSSLVTAVASANRCRAAFYAKLGFVALVGHEVDLDLVELLSTSLLVQAGEAMLAAGRRSRTRSFRHAFLLAYAGRVGERLADADRAAGERFTDERLLPALAERSREVDRLFAELFPRTVPRTTTVSNGEGWAEGRAAADRARLTVERSRIGGGGA
ncbi:DUF2786 domain-containing protein [Amycolatopsis endophytica]|uniref:DUF2786 domain-containing protein n=1 Tax=Amycolatopsis endophytica TaxID=860233 RepID=A0A853B6C5_9PSEU|nr:DUF2786 domain-containing protein [Amycolatopsis endophytica]NYI90629.1 hypothetical protein [Amycolatopsis endophytica]